MKYQINIKPVKNVLLILIGLFFLQVCNGQKDKWSLERCISYAKENNLQIKQLSYDAEIAETNLNTAKNAYLPKLNAGIDERYHIDRTSNAYSGGSSNNNRHNGNVSVNAGIDIFQGLQRRNNVKAKIFSLKAVLLDIEEAKNNLSLNITSIFLDLLFYDELIKSYTVQLIETKEKVSMAKEIVGSGVKTDSYLYDFLAQEAQDSVNLVMAKNDYQTSLIDLIQLLDIREPAGFEIMKPDNLSSLNASISSVDEYYDIALKTLPQLRSSQFRKERAKLNKKYIEGNKYPSLSFETYLGSNYSSNSTLFNSMGEPADYPYFNQLDDNINMYFGLNLRIPIFNRFTVRNSLSIAKIDISKSENNHEIIKQQIFKEVQKAYYDVISAREKMKSMKVLKDAMDVSYNHANEKLRAGVISIYDFNTVMTRYSNATSDYLQSKYEYVFKLKILDFYAGIPLSFDN
ncbi:MAG: TolC family protein [Candidatus Delongbacteria bacterium]|jgi:outer membrane protein|nr:TolC family protein [Candidatus Delongbacteria bacterium]